MYKQNKKFNRKKSFEKSQTNSKAEEYNELNEKHNDDHQQQTWSRICELKDRSLEIIQSEEEKSKKKKRMKRNLFQLSEKEDHITNKWRRNKETTESIYKLRAGFLGKKKGKNKTKSTNQWLD